MRVFAAMFTLLVAAAPVTAAEVTSDSVETLFHELGRLFEITMDNVADEAGEALDRTLSLTFEVTKHDAAQLICATSRFSVESEQTASVTDTGDNKGRGEERVMSQRGEHQVRLPLDEAV